MTDSPLRQHGVYTFHGRPYLALHLASHEGEAWGSTALITHPFDVGPVGMLYLRHEDLILLDYRDFGPVGTMADLVDTGQTDPPPDEAEA